METFSPAEFKTVSFSVSKVFPEKPQRTPTAEFSKSLFFLLEYIQHTTFGKVARLGVAITNNIFPLNVKVEAITRLLLVRLQRDSGYCCIIKFSREIFSFLTRSCEAAADCFVHELNKVLELQGVLLQSVLLCTNYPIHSW